MVSAYAQKIKFNHVLAAKRQAQVPTRLPAVYEATERILQDNIVGFCCSVSSQHYQYHWNRFRIAR